MKNIYLIIFCIVSLTGYGQEWDFEKPNYRRIHKTIKKKKSNLFYDSLYHRYFIADTTLTVLEKRHLYYGYAFNKKYAPYTLSDYHDSLKVILLKEKHSKTELNSIIQFTDSILIAYPFDLRALNYQIYALEQSGRTIDFERRIIQFLTVVDAILSSGKGTSKEDAFYVINPTHEYVVLNILGFEFGGTQSLIDHYDYLTISENEPGIDGLFFDVSPCLNSMAKMINK